MTVVITTDLSDDVIPAQAGIHRFLLSPSTGVQAGMTVVIPTAV